MSRPCQKHAGYVLAWILKRRSSSSTMLQPAASRTPPRWHPRVLAMSGVTDPYQPVERRLRLTRRSLEVLAEFRNPVMVVTARSSRAMSMC